MKCKQNKEKCMFIKEGKCGILNDTTFKRPCPFYKERPLETIQDRFFDGVLFRSIQGYDGKYYVSEQGVVVNWLGRVVKSNYLRDRVCVQLKDDLTQRTTRKSVAIIVADAFIPGTGKVEFRDGNPNNCDRWNLYRVGD